MTSQSRVFQPFEYVSGLRVDDVSRKRKSVKPLVGRLDLPDATMLLGPECPRFVVASDKSMLGKVEGLVSRAPEHYSMSDMGSRERTYNGQAKSNFMAYCGFFLESKKAVCFWCNVKIGRLADINQENHMIRAPWCLFARALVGREPNADERELCIDLLMRDPAVRDLIGQGFNRELMEKAMGFVYDKKLPSLNVNSLLRLCAHVMEQDYKPEAGPWKQECRICYGGGVDVVFLPCGHAIACLSCSKEMKTCPVCRSDVGARHLLKIIN